jgi:ribosomal protein RSM22 (predicted rRNA methylase)
VTGARTDLGRDAFRAAIEDVLACHGPRELAAGAERLMGAYRSGDLPSAPVLGGRGEAAAYAAYRMPATEAAAGAALEQVGRALPGWAPTSLVDIGSGTGATAWAAARTLPSLTDLVLLEQSPAAIAISRAIFDRPGVGPLQRARWVQWRLADGDGSAPLPGADLATAAYVLGELDPQQRRRLVSLAVACAPAVVVVEPGTPAGYRRIVEVRAQLRDAGLTLVAPCPHQLACPLEATSDDWCHFAERVERSATHRRAKSAQLAHEDEKFSFVAAVRDREVHPPAARVIRRPQYRKGLVTLDLCAADGDTREQLVGKRLGTVHRAARKVSWGDRWEHAPLAQDG